MTRFLLIRHAVTDFIDKRLMGRVRGVHLNEAGHLQSQKLANMLGDLPISAIYSSPLERAVETSGPLSKLLDIPTLISEDFLEIDFGEWTNRPFKELETDPQFKLFNTFRSGTRIPSGELMLKAQMRIITGLENLCVLHQNETVAVISHSDLIKSALAYYAGSPLDMFQRIEISPASISVVEIYDETARIIRINDTGDFKF